MTLSAPLVASSAPVAAASVPSTVTSSAAAAETDQRLVRGSRGTERNPLVDGTSAVVRQQFLLAAHNDMAAKDAALKKKAAVEAKKKAAAEAEKKAAAQAKKKAEKEAAAKKKRAAEAKKKAERVAEAAAAQARADRLGYDPDTTGPKAIAKQMMQNKFGWGSKQFSCYNNIIMRESAWKIDADNPTSSAYGIPQALPGSKMSSAGSDWRTNPATQIEWGLGYVKSRYGTPCSAWGFKSSHGWY